MRRFLKNFAARLESYASRWWYSPLVATLAALDAYIVFVPNEALLLPAVLAHPKKWFRITLWTSLGSAIGASSFAHFCGLYGGPFLERFDPHIFHSHGWKECERIINAGGAWGLAFVSFSPLPQHAAVALVGLAHMNWTIVLAAVFLGRAVKYTLIAWCAVHSPRVLRKLRILPPNDDDRRDGGAAQAPAPTT